MVNEHSINIQVESEQTKLLYKALPASVVANLLAGVLVVMAQWSAVEHSILLWWLVVFETIIVLRGILYLKYSVTKNISDYKPWKTAFTVAAAVTGIAWGVAGVIFFPSDNQLHQMVLAFFLLGLSSGAVSSHSFHKAAPYSFIFAALIPLLLRFIYEASELGYVMAAVLALCIVYLLGSSRRGCETTIENIKLRFEAIEKEHEVEESRREAEQANRAKGDFLSSISHELRTPMNAILGFSQILEMKMAEGETNRKFAKEITAAGNHLLTLINELLELSTIEAGKIELDIKDEHITPVIKECISLMMPLADERGITMTYNDEVASDFLVKIDAIKFKQALLNLISNATKYNDEEGSVTIETRVVENNYLRVTVTDTGKGLDEEQQKLLFNPFERIHAHKTDIEGTGIGLVITKRIIELMGGSIGVKSAKDQGSSFWLDVKLSSKGRSE